jgi:hypothetical protein
MTRETLQAILRSAKGIAEKNGVFRVPTDHRVAVYLGTEGNGMVVNQVEEIKLEDAFVTLSTAEIGQVYAEYGTVYAVSVKPPKPNAPSKAGFA